MKTTEDPLGVFRVTNAGGRGAPRAPTAPSGSPGPSVLLLNLHAAPRTARPGYTDHFFFANGFYAVAPLRALDSYYSNTLYSESASSETPSRVHGASAAPGKADASAVALRDPRG